MGECSGARIGTALVVLLVMIVIFLVGALILGIFASAGYGWAYWGQGVYWLGGIIFMGYVTHLIGFSCDSASEHPAIKTEEQKA